MKTAGLILSAGESRRMGSPKALLPYDGDTFLGRLIGLFLERCDPVVVVLGCGAEEIRARTTRPARFVINTDYTRGQTSSMQRGLRAIPPDSEGVLFTLVDHPAVAPSTLDALLAESTGLLRVPRYQGRRGHPIWFARAMMAEFLAIPDTGAARDVVRKYVLETDYLDLDDPGIVADVDDPEAYRDLVGAEA